MEVRAFPLRQLGPRNVKAFNAELRNLPTQHAREILCESEFSSSNALEEIKNAFDVPLRDRGKHGDRATAFHNDSGAVFIIIHEGTSINVGRVMRLLTAPPNGHSAMFDVQFSCGSRRTVLLFIPPATTVSVSRLNASSGDTNTTRPLNVAALPLTTTPHTATTPPRSPLRVTGALMSGIYNYDASAFVSITTRPLDGVVAAVCEDGAIRIWRPSQAQHDVVAVGASPKKGKSDPKRVLADLDAERLRLLRVRSELQNLVEAKTAEEKTAEDDKKKRAPKIVKIKGKRAHVGIATSRDVQQQSGVQETAVDFESKV